MGIIHEDCGMPVGDEVLEQVAARWKTCLREYDILARFDGDEFAVLLPGADVLAAHAVGERMARAVEASPLGERLPRRVTISTGAALWNPPSAESGKTSCDARRARLAEARGLGGGKSCVDR